MSECKGYIARFRSHTFTTYRGYSVKEEFYKLKTKSCPGCAKCDSMDDDLENLYSRGTTIEHGPLKDGDLVKLTSTGVITRFKATKIEEDK